MNHLYKAAFAAIYRIKLIRNIHQEHAGLAVVFRKANLNKLASGGGDVLADVIGAYRQFAVPAIHQHGKLYRFRPAAAENSLDRGARGAAGVQHVVHEHNVPVCHVERKLRASHKRRVGQSAQIVAVKANVDAAAAGVNALDFLNIAADDLGDRLPTAADADKYGWGLTDPERGTSSLFIGAGRRRYDNSTILNVYNPVTVRSVAEEAQPWEGLYWTAGTLSGTKSPAFHFWFEKKTTGGALENNVPYARANGMSVRCVRVQ